MTETPRIPSLALSNALLFADPATDVLQELQNCTEWFDALVLATPFWAPGTGKLNKPIRPDDAEVSALVSASMAFDPDRELRIEAFDPEKVSDSARALLLGARHVQLQTSITAELLPALAELIPNVTAMVVPRASQLGDTGPAFLASLTNLQELSISIGIVAEGSMLASLTSLRKLHMMGSCSDGDLSAFAVLKNLESLSLSFMGNVSVDLSGLSPLTFLRELRLNGCDREGLSDIALLASLQSLTVSNSDSLADISALTSIKKLRELTLINCHKLQDISPLTSLPSLTTVTLRGCHDADDVSVLATSKTLQTLMFTNKGEGSKELASLLRERGDFSVEASGLFVTARRLPAPGSPLNTAASPESPTASTAVPKEGRNAGSLSREEGPGGQMKADPWAFDENTLPSDVPVELLDTFIGFLKSDDLKENIHGTMMLRKLFDVLPKQQLIDAGYITTCVAQLLRDESPTLQLQSAWSLTNIAADDDSFTQLVSEEPGAVPNLARLLRSPTENCREQAAWVIGNMCDTAEQRDRSLESGALELLLENVTAADRAMPTKVKSGWALSKLFRVKPRPPPAVVASALPILAEMLIHEDEDELVVYGAWALSYLSDGDRDRIQQVLETGCLPRLIELLVDEDSKKVLPAIRTIGNIVTGNDRQTDAVINGGALPAFHSLLGHPRTSILKEVCWTLSNITVGNQEQIQAVLDANLLPAVMQVGETSRPEVRKEAAWVVTNISSCGSADQIRKLVQHGEALPYLCRRLRDSSVKVMAVALEGLDKILDIGERDRVEQMRDTNRFVDVILDGGLFEHIAQLQDTDHMDIWNHLQLVLESYFFA